MPSNVDVIAAAASASTLLECVVLIWLQQHLARHLLDLVIADR